MDDSSPPVAPPVCRACGAALTPRREGQGQLCLGCLLEPALAGSETLVAEPPADLIGAPPPEDVGAAGPFAHYALALDSDGTPVELGRGAMGVTYRALDTVLRCPVALKVVRPEIGAHPRARARFLREARAAAGLRHPHVASVFFFGERPGDGQPFYAMELVEGETLEARVRRAGGLPVEAVLAIGSQVAEALAAAEARGLLHRDLKPANLMLVEGAGIQVKVIDFGLAKAATAVPAGGEETALTRREEFVGTPAFASPEQLDQTGREPLDARSDFYALGATLWYALTGKAPFAGRSLAEIADRQQHRELPVAQLRAARTPAPLVELLCRLLSADPADRPQTARELAAALAECRQPRRARRPTLAGSGRELAVILGVLLLGAGLFAALRHRTDAIARQNNLLQRQTLAQGQQLAALQTQLQQQTQLISQVNAKIERNAAVASGGDPTRNDPAAAAQAAVARERGISVGTLQGQLAGERADLHQLLAQIDQRLAAAQTHVEQWRRLKREALTRLGDGEHAAGRYPTAVEPYQQALALADADQEPLAWGDIARGLVVVLRQLGRYQEAAPLAQQIVDRRTTRQGPEHPDTLRAAHDQAHLLFAQGSHAEAEALFRRTLAAQERTLGKDHPDTLRTVNILSNLLHYRGKDAEAEALGRRCVEACERTLGPDDPLTLNALNNLAVTLHFEGNYVEAAALNRRCLEARERLLGPDHPDTIISVNNLAIVLTEEGDWVDAEPLLRRALAAQERTLGPEHPITLTVVHNLADLLQDKGDLAEAEAFGRRCVEGQERVLGPDHPDTLSSLSNLAQLLDAKGDPAAAEPLYQQAQARMERLLTPQDIVRLDLEHFFSLFRERQGRLAEALALAAQAAEGCQGLPENSPTRRTYEQHYQTLRAKVTPTAPPLPPGQDGAGNPP